MDDTQAKAIFRPGSYRLIPGRQYSSGTGNHTGNCRTFVGTIISPG